MTFVYPAGYVAPANINSIVVVDDAALLVEGIARSNAVQLPGATFASVLAGINANPVDRSKLVPYLRSLCIRPAPNGGGGVNNLDGAF
jgi:hypothetical protein